MIYLARFLPLVSFYIHQRQKTSGSFVFNGNRKSLVVWNVLKALFCADYKPTGYRVINSQVAF